MTAAPGPAEGAGAPRGPWFALTDGAVVAVALAAVAGARVGGGPGVGVGAVLCLAGVGARRALLVVLGVALVAAGLSDRALAGLHPAAAAPVDGWVTLVGDPEPLDGGGLRVVVSHEGRRMEATAHGRAGSRLAGRLAGEHVQLRGRARPAGPDDAWLLAQRVVGRLAVDEVGAWRPGSAGSRVANGLRRTLRAGADHLPERARTLLLGVVLGDDRAQPPEVADDFRAAGMTHLQAVSGQNVALVLLLLSPLLSRLGWVVRLPATLLAVAFFCLVVRFEPSVVRAAGMTAVAATAAALGRPAAGIRVLGLAVAGLVLVDPLLARSLGFGLSASASAGILLLAPRLREALRGPAAARELLAVTLAAQAGALPLLVATFGAVPVATVPANLLAVPAAGALMVWGLGAGLVAGAAAAHGLGWLAAGLHLPTSVLTWWLAAVAEWAAGLPLGQVDGPLALAAAAVGVAARAARPLLDRAPPALATVGAALALLAALGAPSAPGEGRVAVARGVELVAAGGVRVVVLDAPLGAARSLEALRLAGLRCPDAVVVVAGSRRAAALAGALERRCGLPVLAPAGLAHPGWRPVGAGEAVTVGPLVVVGHEATATVHRRARAP